MLTQAHRYDGKGRYVRHWLPEIAILPDYLIHTPAALSPKELYARFNLKIGRDYPLPIVDMGIFDRGGRHTRRGNSMQTNLF